MILLRSHQSILHNVPLCIPLIYFRLYIYSWCCWYRIILFIFQTLTIITLLQDKHKTWATEAKPVNGTSVIKNSPSSPSVIARILCLDVWLRGLQKSKTDCSSSGRAEMVELRCDCQVIQSKREKRKRRLTTCGLIPDESFTRKFGIVEFFQHVLMLFMFFCKCSMLFHIDFVLLPQILSFLFS